MHEIEADEIAREEAAEADDEIAREEADEIATQQAQEAAAEAFRLNMEAIAAQNTDCKLISEASHPDTPRAFDWAELAPPALTADVTARPGALPDSEFLLSLIRTATLRARLMANELDTVGVSLKRNLITVEGAMEWLHDLSLLDHVIGPKVFHEQ